MHQPNAALSLRAPLRSLLTIGLSLLTLAAPLFSASKGDWLPVTPEELAATASTIEPHAPAEVLFRKIEMNDRDLPEERVIREYIRYKVYQPDKAEAVTRISRQEANSSDGFAKTDVELSARLIQPNGTITTFGKEAIRERTLTESAAEHSLLRTLFGAEKDSRKEKFIAISGIEAGSIVEYRIETTAHYPNDVLYAYVLQLRDLPTRKLEFLNKSIRGEKYSYGCFLLNKRIGNAELKEDTKESEVHITASDLPSLAREPFSGVPPDYALVLLNCYKKTTLTLMSRSGVSQHYTMDPSKTGYWSPTATDAYVLQEDCAVATGRVKEITRELMTKASTPIAKARLIHQYAQERYVEFRKIPPRKFDYESYLHNRVRSLDDVLDYAKEKRYVGASRNDFVWLAMVMYQLAGLECRQILLPNRELVTFNRVLVSSVLLGERALQVKIDGQWIFSCPGATTLLPFGALPWFSEGQEALIAQPAKEEFILTPSSVAKQSMIGNGGNFELSPDGTLTGIAKRKYIGHSAEVIRSVVSRRKDPKAQNQFFLRMLHADFKKVGAFEAGDDSADKDEETTHSNEPLSLRILKITGIETAGEIEVEYSVTIKGYCITAGDKLIIRPSVFRHNFTSPFTSPTRITRVRFPYPWQELDAVGIKLPPGYVPEISEQPAFTPSAGLYYRNQLSFDPAKQVIRLRREFSCQNAMVPAEGYAALKNGFDEMVRSDQSELVLVKSTASTVASQTSTPAP